MSSIPRRCTCFDDVPDVTLQLDLKQSQLLCLGIHCLGPSFVHLLSEETIPPAPAIHLKNVVMAFLRLFYADKIIKLSELEDSNSEKTVTGLLFEVQMETTPLFEELTQALLSRISELPYCEFCRSSGAPEKRPKLDMSLPKLIIGDPDDTEGLEKEYNEMMKRFEKLNPDIE